MANPFKASLSYIQSSVAELKKVTWPTKEMTQRYSLLVIVVSISIALLFAGLDYVFNRVITGTIAQNSASTATTEEPVIPNVEATDIENTANNTSLDIQAETTDGQTIQIEPSSVDAPDNTVSSQSE